MFLRDRRERSRSKIEKTISAPQTARGEKSFPYPEDALQSDTDYHTLRVKTKKGNSQGKGPDTGRKKKEGPQPRLEKESGSVLSVGRDRSEKLESSRRSGNR